MSFFSFSSYSQLDLLLARTINQTGFDRHRPVTSITQQHQPTAFTHMSNTNYQRQGMFDIYSSSMNIVFFAHLDHSPSRPQSTASRDKDDVEALVNAVLDTSGIDRRYSPLILAELRDSTNLTHDQLRQAAYELTNQLRSTNPPPQYSTMNSTTNSQSSNERFYDSSTRYPNV